MLKAVQWYCVLLLAIAALLSADTSRESWMLVVPELAGLQAEADPAHVNSLLDRAGKQIDLMFEDIAEISMAENVTELKFDTKDFDWTSRQAAFRYIVKMPFNESRNSDYSEVTTVPGFVEVLRFLASDSQKSFRFDSLGQISEANSKCEVVAFQSIFPDGSNFEGLVWLDSNNGAIQRIRVELPGNRPVTIDVNYIPVYFKSRKDTVWLPRSGTVSAHHGRLESRTIHRFSDYQLSVAGDNGVATLKPEDSDATAATGGRDRPLDAIELLGQAAGVTDATAKEALLQQALKLEPERPETHFQIAIALWRKNALPDAETELRGALRGAPEGAEIHDLLGIVLLGRGDIVGAVSEFRAALTLQPENATSHFNLGEALDRLGDTVSALEEYRKAVTLDPDTKSFAERLDSREQPKVDAAADKPIQVDVRQVLVPVVVTRDGHHVSGLAREDFHVFEDGVEQKIAAFRVAKGELEEEAALTFGTVAPKSPNLKADETKPARVKSTYLICIDSLHMAFSNLAYIREAMIKLFAREQKGDSQYLVVTIGSQITMVRDTTNDPAAVLAAMKSKEFEKAYLGGRQGSSSEAQMATFRRDLEQVRGACDRRGDALLNAMCGAGKQRLEGEAEQLAEFERPATIEFLRQLGFLVQQLATGKERRSLVLLSDGFTMVPGQSAYLMLGAVFPELQGAALRANERITGELEPMLRLAQQKNVTVYTIDSRGLYTMPLYSPEVSGGSSRTMQVMGTALDRVAQSAGDTLKQIAADTGGTAFHDNNDLLAGMEQAFEDGRDYYVLAYVPTNTAKDNIFRTISITLNNRKLQVRAKTGYWPY